MLGDTVESFHIRFNGKNYSAWKFQFKLFVKGKELCGHIDGSASAPLGVEALSKWEIKDARIMTWILSSVKPHLVLNLKPYKTVAAITLCCPSVHATSKRDQFLMKLQLDFEIARSNMMNRHPVPSLDACLSELLREEQRIVTQAAMEHWANVSAPVPSLDACLSELLREEQRIVTQAAMEHWANVSAPVSVPYAAQGRSKGRDMRVVQCFSCKAFGHIARDCPKKFCNYCMKQGHIISACPIRPKRKQGTAYHASTGASSSTTLPTASPIIPIPHSTALANPNTLTPEMDQVSGKMIAKGPKVGRLFPLHVSPSTVIPSFPLLSFACNVFGSRTKMWHRRLGYPNSDCCVTRYCFILTGTILLQCCAERAKDIVESHYKACLYAGINISAINGEAMPGEVGPIVGISAGDELWVARYILEVIYEIAGVVLPFDPKPIQGDRVGAGILTIFSPNSMRKEGGFEVLKAAKKIWLWLKKRVACGEGIKAMTAVSLGAANRVAPDMDPNVVTSMIAETRFQIFWFADE
ncbi:hypothetical protein Patl1_21197 [Pistacia atlantica]|uniref:Uncharacterized protein n=1 Tax=Pistacia atlantica TaxID=434234 RepID=A0ACC1BP03_9ROSI|nr:hypothetical protein Patl1_21197 [Pistacia atlantica]